MVPAQAPHGRLATHSSLSIRLLTTRRIYRLPPRSPWYLKGECYICWEPFTLRSPDQLPFSSYVSNAVATSCSHRFHTRRLLRWVDRESRRTCLACQSILFIHPLPLGPSKGEDLPNNEGMHLGRLYDRFGWRGGGDASGAEVLSIHWVAVVSRCIWWGLTRVYDALLIAKVCEWSWESWVRPTVQEWFGRG